MRDFTNTKASTRFEGIFPAKVETIEDKLSKKGKEMLVVEFKVVGEDYKDFKIKKFFVWENARASNEFAALLDATDTRRNLEKYSEIHGKTCNIEVVYSKKNEQSELVDFTQYVAPTEEI